MLGNLLKDLRRLIVILGHRDTHGHEGATGCGTNHASAVTLGNRDSSARRAMVVLSSRKRLGVAIDKVPWLYDLSCTLEVRMIDVEPIIDDRNDDIALPPGHIPGVGCVHRRFGNQLWPALGVQMPLSFE